MDNLDDLIEEICAKRLECLNDTEGIRGQEAISIDVDALLNKYDTFLEELRHRMNDIIGGQLAQCGPEQENFVPIPIPNANMNNGPIPIPNINNDPIPIPNIVGGKKRRSGSRRRNKRATRRRHH